MTPKDIIGPCMVAQGQSPIDTFYDYVSTNHLKNGMNIAEVGVFMGRSAIYLADTIKKSGMTGIKFYCIDHFSGSSEHNSGPKNLKTLYNDPDFLYNNFSKNVKECGVEELITTIKMDSTEASKTFADGFFDFVFIDASHEYEYVKHDINSWLPKIKVGGIIGGDDYHPAWDGVIKAVNEIFGDKVKTHGSTNWYIQL